MVVASRNQWGHFTIKSDLKKMIQSSVSSPSYLCINCKYVCWSGKGPFRCLSPSLLSPVEDWPCWLVEGPSELWLGCKQKNKFWRKQSSKTVRLKREVQHFWKPEAGVDHSRELGDERKCAADETKRNAWWACNWLTVGLAEFSWGLLAWCRGGFGELGGVREAHTRWSIWYSSCCRSQRSSLLNNVQPLHV